MAYYISKSNPFKSNIPLALGDLFKGVFNEWTVGSKCLPSDKVFIAQSGVNASILALVEVMSAPRKETDDTSSPYWFDKDEINKFRFWSKIRPLCSRTLMPVSEKNLLKTGLSRIADFLHRQGAILKLIDIEGKTLEDLVMKCPVCGFSPCNKTGIFLKRAGDLYVNGCLDGVIPCPDCGTDGNIIKREPCWNCYNKTLPPGAVCPICKNRRFIGSEIIKCPTCKGSGIIKPALL